MGMYWGTHKKTWGDILGTISNDENIVGTSNPTTSTQQLFLVVLLCNKQIFY